MYHLPGPGHRFRTVTRSEGEATTRAMTAATPAPGLALALPGPWPCPAGRVQHPPTSTPDRCRSRSTDRRSARPALQPRCRRPKSFRQASTKRSGRGFGLRRLPDTPFMFAGSKSRHPRPRFACYRIDIEPRDDRIDASAIIPIGASSCLTVSACPPDSVQNSNLLDNFCRSADAVIIPEWRLNTFCAIPGYRLFSSV